MKWIIILHWLKFKTVSIPLWFFLRIKNFELSNKITVKKNEVIFTIIDLDPPKPMTKEQIEKILGYKINIVS